MKIEMDEWFGLVIRPESMIERAALKQWLDKGAKLKVTIGSQQHEGSVAVSMVRDLKAPPTTR